jgi:hypothetical protein
MLAAAFPRVNNNRLKLHTEIDLLWHYQRASAAPQVKPPPIASISTRHPSLIR